MELELLPATDDVVAAMKCAEIVAEALKSEPSDSIGREEWHRQVRAAQADLRQLLPLIEHQWLLRRRNPEIGYDYFKVILEVMGRPGEDLDGGGRLGDISLDDAISLARSVAARAQAEQSLKEARDRATQLGKRQQARAVAAGKTRIPLKESQVQEACRNIETLMQNGETLQGACKRLAGKYGVHYATLKRYYSKR